MNLSSFSRASRLKKAFSLADNNSPTGSVIMCHCNFTLLSKSVTLDDLEPAPFYGPAVPAVVGRRTCKGVGSRSSATAEKQRVSWPHGG